MPPVLIIVCGLPGSGKTTQARRLAEGRNGVRLAPDDWLTLLGISLWDGAARDLIERLQWDLTRDLLRVGNVVIIEWGTWSRAEREGLRTTAVALGARVELMLLDPSREELWRRIQSRGQEDPPITCADLDRWDRLFERPDDAELAAYDAATLIVD